MGHNDLTVISPWDGPIVIDRGMARLLRLLWDHGIPTAYSCAGRHAGDGRDPSSGRYVSVGEEADIALAAAVVHSVPEGATMWPVSLQGANGPRRPALYCMCRLCWVAFVFPRSHRHLPYGWPVP